MRNRRPKPTLAKHQPLTADLDAQLKLMQQMKARQDERWKDKLGLELSTDTIRKNLERAMNEMKTVVESLDKKK